MLFKQRFEPMDLLNMYRKERAAACGELEGSKFKSFKEWREEYEEEWNDSHGCSSFMAPDTAVEITEAELEPRLRPIGGNDLADMDLEAVGV